MTYFDSFSVKFPFDSDDPQFRRGVEVGMLWASVEHTGCAHATVHADCAEMIMRIAEAKNLQFEAHEVGDNWLHVIIGDA